MGVRRSINHQHAATAYAEVIASIKPGSPVPPRGELWLTVSKSVPLLTDEKRQWQRLPSATRERYTRLVAASRERVEAAIREAIASGGWRAVRTPEMTQLFVAHGWGKTKVSDYARSVMKSMKERARPRWLWDSILPQLAELCAQRVRTRVTIKYLAASVSPACSDRGTVVAMSQHTLRAYLQRHHPELLRSILHGKRRGTEPSK